MKRRILWEKKEQNSDEKHREILSFSVVLTLVSVYLNYKKLTIVLSTVYDVG